MAQVQEMPPRGHYLADEVGALAGVSGATIGQWKNYGYIRASQEAHSYPLIYSYQDVGEAMIVHELRLANVPRAEIRATIENLRNEYGEWPLAHAPLHAQDGILALNDGGALIDFGVRRGQGLIIGPDDLARVRTALNRGGWAVRDHPELEHIEVIPNRLSGRPSIRGTRLGAEHVARMALDEDDGVQILRDDYGLNDAEISDAKTWLTLVRGYEQKAA